MKTVTVTGINGAQQHAIADAFTRRGWTVRPTARRVQPTPFGEARQADLLTGDGLTAALAGADAAAVTLPQDHAPGHMLRFAQNVVAAAREARLPLLVLNLATLVPDHAEGSLFDDLRAVRAAAAEVPHVLVETTVFMDNLLQPWATSAIAGGALPYPVPDGVRVSWISHRTLGEAIAAAAERGPGHHRIGGPEALTGDEMAAALARRTGRPVRFVSVPLPDFAAGIDAAFGPPAGERIVSLYAHLAADPSAMALPADTAAALGAEAERFETFIARQAVFARDAA